MALSSLTNAYEVSGLVHSGRQALLQRDFDKARECFEKAVDKDPSYVATAAHFSEGVWSYLGRAQYATARFPEARQSLERALAICEEDHLARLYFGMTLLRLGGDAVGLRELQEGLQRLHDWIENTVNSRPFETYWDPNGQIRSEIRNALGLIAAKSDQANLLSSVEWLGHEIENEIDRARRDESRDRSRW
ncbi:MAG: tetratricopeptide repeat protein [Candidatus Binatia bacterium]